MKKRRLLALLLTFCILLSTAPLAGLTINSEEEDSSKLKVTKKINWTPGSDEAEVVITSNIPDKNETQVLFLGTLCGNHAMKDDTIKESLNAIAQNADVRYYLLNKGESTATSANTGTISRGSTMSKSYTVASGGNHAALEGFINTLYKELITDKNGFDSTKETKVDYIVLEFDGTRLADSFSSSTAKSKLDALAKELKKYYDAGKVIWITDGRVWNGNSKKVGYTSTDGYTPTNVCLYGGDGSVKFLSADIFRSFCGVVAPSYYLSHTSTTTGGYYGDGKTAYTLDSSYQLPLITRTSGTINKSSYNDARQLSYADAESLAEFLYMVIPGVTLDFNDQIVFSDDITVTSVTTEVTTASTVGTSTSWTARGNITVANETVKTGTDNIKYVSGGTNITNIKVTTGNTDSSKNNLVSITAGDLKGADPEHPLTYFRVTIKLKSTNKFFDCIELKTDEKGNPIYDKDGNFQFVMNPNDGPVEVDAYSGSDVTEGSAIAEGESIADAPAVNLRKITSEVVNGTKSQTDGLIKSGEENNNPVTVYSYDGKTVSLSYSPDPGCALKTITVDGTTYTLDNFKTSNTVTATDYTVTKNTDGSLKVVFANLAKDHAVKTVFECVLSVEKTAPSDKAKGGESVTYSIKISNPTASAVTGLKLSDTLDSNLTYSSSSDSGSHKNGVVSWSGITVPANGSKTVTVTVKTNAYITSDTIVKNIAVLKNSKDEELKKSPENKITVSPRAITVKYAYIGDTKPSTATPPTSDSSTYGATYTTKEQAAVTGWSFSGWYTSSSATKLFASGTDKLDKDTFSALSTADEVTLYGKWTQITITVSGTSYSGKYDGQSHGTAATASATLPNGTTTTEGITIKYSTDGGTTWTETVPTVKDAITSAITVKVKASKDGYTDATCEYTLNVTKREVTLTSGTDTKEYNGSPLTKSGIDVSGDGFVGTEGVTPDITGSQTDVGYSSNTYTYSFKDNTKATNYTITQNYGTLTVTASDDLTVEGTSYSGKYDAQNHGSAATPSITEGTTVKYSTDGGVTWSETVPTVKNYTPTTITVKVKAENPNYVTAYDEYTLSVSKRAITLTSGTDTKEYNGSPLTKSGIDVSGDNFAGEEGADYEITGSQTDVGYSANAFTYEFQQGTNPDNYTVTKVEGTLTVTPCDDLTVEGTSYSGKYDGQNHGDAATPSVTEGTTVKYSTDGGTTWTETVPTVKDYTSTPVTVKVKAENPNYVTAYDEYTLTVTKRSITMTSGTDSKKYDKTPLTKGGITETGDGFITGEGAEYDVTGSQTDVGNSANVFTYEFKQGTNPDNYSVTTVEGTLTVTKKTDVIIITADSNSKIYDGTALTDDGYTYTEDILEDGDILVVTVAGSQTNVGSTENEVTEYKVLRLTPVNLTAHSLNIVMAVSQPQDVTDFYTFGTPVDGALTVTPRSITLYSPSDTKVYDGTALVSPTVYGGDQGEDVDSVFASEVENLTATGTATNVADSGATNTITYTGKAVFSADNYVITTTEGTLTITPAQLTVEGENYKGLFDDKEHGGPATPSVKDGTTIKYSTDGGETWTDVPPTIKEVGEIEVIVKAENPNYYTTTNTYTLKVSITPSTGDGFVTAAIIIGFISASAVIVPAVIGQKKRNED